MKRITRKQIAIINHRTSGRSIGAARIQEIEFENNVPSYPEKKTRQIYPHILKTAAERKARIEALISEGTLNRIQITETILYEYPGIAKSTIATALTDGKNPKYNRFRALIVEDENGVLSFTNEN